MLMLKEFIRELDGSRIEGEIVRTLFYSIISSIVILIVAYYIGLQNVPDFIGKYGFFLFFCALSYALILPSVVQIIAYKEMTCMAGMMVGMTTGMIAGFLPGYYVGATNGMFVGIVFGIVIGIIFGFYNGKCCGIMGIMEGVMAGFMGGLMGAMTSVMLLNDHLKLASVIVFIVSAFIMFSLNYMIFKEMKEHKGTSNGKTAWITFVLTFILMAVTIYVMVFGPRSYLFG